jgi:hypothetical protein
MMRIDGSNDISGGNEDDCTLYPLAIGVDLSLLVTTLPDVAAAYDFTFDLYQI